MNNPEEMDKLIGMCNLPRLNQPERSIWTDQLPVIEIELVKTKVTKTKPFQSPGQVENICKQCNQ